jgi:hypothetical protein
VLYKIYVPGTNNEKLGEAWIMLWLIKNGDLEGSKKDRFRPLWWTNSPSLIICCCNTR